MKKEQALITVQADGREWYTAQYAAEAMSKRNKRVVNPSYLRSLARLGKISTMPLNANATLYLKSEVDSYVIEERGAKAGAAMKARAKRTSAQEQAKEKAVA